MPSNSKQTEPVTRDMFLPDFCAIPVVFVIVLVAELLAFVLALAPTTGQRFEWQNLGLISLFVQWIALTGTAVLCVARKWLCGFQARTAGLISYGLLMAVTLLLSEAVFWITRYTGMFESLPANWHTDFLMRNLVISMIVSAIALRYLYIQHQWKQKIESESRARVEALQARIRPHFLFNSMNVIASLTRDKPALAEEAIQDLSDLFRVTLRDGDQLSRLRDELDVGRRYLRLEKLRLGDRLNIEWNTEDASQEARLPSLVIQPLLENAIYHGIENIPQGGTVSMSTRTGNDMLEIVITNPLAKDNQNITRHKGNEMAVANVKERLAVFFNNKASMTAENRGDSYIVKLSFPLLTD